MTYLTLFIISVSLYIASACLYLAGWFLRLKNSRQWAMLALIGVTVIHTLILVGRFMDLGYPFYNLREFLSVYPWTLVILLLMIEWRFGYTLLSVMAVPFGAVLMCFAVVLPNAHEQLNPILQSPLLMAHVSIFLMAYAALTLAFAGAISFLLQDWSLRKKKLAWRLPPLHIMDKLSKLLVMVGAALMTAAILLGSIWASNAWGVLWVWEPKQIMSLVTLAIYILYFVMRYFVNWPSRKLAWLVVVGFISIIITFFGAELLAPDSVHSFLF